MPEICPWCHQPIEDEDSEVAPFCCESCEEMWVSQDRQELEDLGMADDLEAWSGEV